MRFINMYVYMYLTCIQLEEAAEALKYCSRAVELTPEDKDIVCDRAEAHILNSDFDKGVEMTPSPPPFPSLPFFLSPHFLSFRAHRTSFLGLTMTNLHPRFFPFLTTRLFFFVCREQTRELHWLPRPAISINCHHCQLFSWHVLILVSLTHTCTASQDYQEVLNVDQESRRVWELFVLDLGKILVLELAHRLLSLFV